MLDISYRTTSKSYASYRSIECSIYICTAVCPPGFTTDRLYQLDRSVSNAVYIEHRFVSISSPTQLIVCVNSRTHAATAVVGTNQAPECPKLDPAVLVGGRKWALFFSVPSKIRIFQIEKKKRRACRAFSPFNMGQS